MDPLSGWTKFRKYTPEVWEPLTSTYPEASWFLSSATLGEEGLQRIAVSVGVTR